MWTRVFVLNRLPRPEEAELVVQKEKVDDGGQRGAPCVGRCLRQSSSMKLLPNPPCSASGGAGALSRSVCRITSRKTHLVGGAFVVRGQRRSQARR